MNPEQPANQIDLRAYAGALWRRKWIVLLLLVVCPAAAYGISVRNAKVYQASALMQVEGPPVDTTLLTGGSSDQPTQQSIEIAARLIDTTAVAAQAARHIQPAASPGALLHALKVNPDTNTGFITLSANAPSPQRAADIANAFANAVVATRSQQATKQIDITTGRLTSELAAIPKGDQLQRRQLSQQIQRLRTLRAAQGSNAQIVEAAEAPGGSISPRPRRAALLGLVVALLLAAGAVVLAESLDRRIRKVQDLETGELPLLALIPQSAFSGKSNTQTDEAFTTLRTSLTFFSVSQAVDSVLVTSPAESEGKTLVSVNLAIANARAGKDVILLDADMRRPQVANRLGGPGAPGLSDLLLDKTDLESCWFDHPVIGPEVGRLRVIPAGPHPPNPSELLGSPRMQSLLEHLKEQCDMVIVDTSPILLVSDAVPLVDEVSGIVVVARLNRTTHEAMKRARAIIAAAGGKVLGAVATGVSDRSPYVYGGRYAASAPVSKPSANGSAEEPKRRLAGLGRRR